MTVLILFVFYNLYLGFSPQGYDFLRTTPDSVPVNVARDFLITQWKSILSWLLLVL